MSQSTGFRAGGEQFAVSGPLSDGLSSLPDAPGLDTIDLTNRFCRCRSGGYCC